MKGSCTKGFTLLELIVSIGIFVFMTALLVAKFGTFNQSTLLTNLVYDAALTLRTAQTFGIGAVNTGSASFQYAHGVHFTTQTTTSQPSTDNTKIILFTDRSTNPDAGVYTAGITYDGAPDNIYTITRGASVSYICEGDEVNCSSANTSRGASLTSVDITFKRPDPSAIICVNGATCKSSTGKSSIYIEISIPGVSAGTRGIVVRNNGQISVLK